MEMIKKSVAKAVGGIFKNEPGYSAVKITKLSSGTFTLDHDALKGLLFRPEIGNRPIALISIAGCLRTGKSFLLNFLLRYLRNEGWHNENWIGDSETKLDDGINWRGGQEPNTTGILVWDEVFTVKKRNGDEIAVLLMDTQGLFDKNTSKDNNIRLLMTSAIASSVQLLNLKNLIETRDLENLHTCVEFALTAAKTNQRHFKLQTLLVIIRDWDNVHENPFGLEGGNRYLESNLSLKEGGKELNEVREYLKDTFTKLECYLMPEPGKKVRRSGDEQLENKQIDDEFMEHVQLLADHLLFPDNIVAKQSLGRNMTAREILNLLATTDSSFGTGKIVVEDLLANSIKAHYASAYENCIALYKSEIGKHLDHTLGSLKDDLIRYHEEALVKANEKFDSTPEMGPQEKRDEFRKHLKEQCENQFQTIMDCNNLLLLQKSEEMREYTEKLYEEYKTKMDKTKGSTSVLEAAIRENHDTILKEVSEKNSAKTDMELLNSKASTYFKEMVAQNIEKKRQEDKLREKEEEMNQHKRIEELVIGYEKTLDKEIVKLPSDKYFESTCKSKSQQVKEKFEEEFHNCATFQTYSAVLTEKLEKSDKTKKSALEEKYGNALKAVKLQVDSYVLQYRKIVKEKMQDEYISPDSMKKGHEQALQLILKSWDEKYGSYPSSITNGQWKICKDKVDKEFKTLQKENANNKDHRAVQSNNSGGGCTIL